MVNVKKLSNHKISIKDLIFYLQSLIVVFTVFVISLVLCSYYVGGDQHAYIKLYNNLPSLGLIEAQEYYSRAVTSKELVHFTFSFIFSRITDKSVFIAIFNSVLVYSALVLFRRWGAHFWISAIILLSNYYAYVLYFPAERLKFGVIFLIVSLIFAETHKKSVLYSVFSCLAHFQMIIFYSSLLFEYCISKLKKLFFDLKLSLYLLLILLFPILIFMLFSDELIHKIHVAMDNSYGIRSVAKPLVFLMGSLIYSKNKISIIYLFIPIVIAAFFIGDSRVNMFCFFIFLYTALPVRNGFNVGIVLTIVYFGIKNFFFVDQILKYGNGFYL